MDFLYFNPTMVRLIQPILEDVQIEINGFQSHYGSINTSECQKLCWVLVNFNPTMVRLIHALNIFFKFNYRYFNPTMVRLIQTIKRA